MSLNKVMIIGHLGQDPEIRYTPTGLPVVNFSVATDEAYVDKEGKRQERVEWHRVVVIGKPALRRRHPDLGVGCAVLEPRAGRAPARPAERGSNGRSTQIDGTPPNRGLVGV